MCRVLWYRWFAEDRFRKTYLSFKPYVKQRALIDFRSCQKRRFGSLQTAKWKERKKERNIAPKL